MPTKASLKGAKENLVTTELGLPTGVRLWVSHREGSPPGVSSGLRPLGAAGTGKGLRERGVNRGTPRTKVGGAKPHAGGAGECREVKEE